MKNTTNYQLNKPEANEKVNIDLLNENMDIVDRNLNDLASTIAPINSKIGIIEELIGDGFESVTEEEIHGLFAQ